MKILFISFLFAHLFNFAQKLKTLNKFDFNCPLSIIYRFLPKISGQLIVLFLKSSIQ